jgi:hypothetical protein
MRKELILFSTLLAAPVAAKDITVTFTEEELKVQMAMNDQALRAAGSAAAQAFVVLDNKYKAAMDHKEAPKK